MNLLPLVDLLVSVVLLTGAVTIAMTVLWLLLCSRGYGVSRK